MSVLKTKSTRKTSDAIAVYYDYFVHVSIHILNLYFVVTFFINGLVGSRALAYLSESASVSGRKGVEGEVLG